MNTDTENRTEVRTGATASATDSQAGPVAVVPTAPAGPPSVHVRAVITWLAIFPLVAIGMMLIAPFAESWHPVLRAFALTLVVVPLGYTSWCRSSCAATARFAAAPRVRGRALDPPDHGGLAFAQADACRPVPDPGGPHADRPDRGP